MTCEECQFWDGEKCTDPDPQYDDVCRYNPSWQDYEDTWFEDVDQTDR